MGWRRHCLWCVPIAPLGWHHCSIQKMPNRWWRIITRSPEGRIIISCLWGNNSHAAKCSPGGISNGMQGTTSPCGYLINTIEQHTDIRDQLIMVRCMVINSRIKLIFNCSWLSLNWSCKICNFVMHHILHLFLAQVKVILSCHPSFLGIKPCFNTHLHCLQDGC